MLDAPGEHLIEERGLKRADEEASHPARRIAAQAVSCHPLFVVAQEAEADLGVVAVVAEALAPVAVGHAAREQHLGDGLGALGGVGHDLAQAQREAVALEVAGAQFIGVQLGPEYLRILQLQRHDPLRRDEVGGEGLLRDGAGVLQAGAADLPAGDAQLARDFFQQCHRGHIALADAEEGVLALAARLVGRYLLDDEVLNLLADHAADAGQIICEIRQGPIKHLLPPVGIGNEELRI